MIFTEKLNTLEAEVEVCGVLKTKHKNLKNKREGTELEKCPRCSSAKEHFCLAYEAQV